MASKTENAERIAREARVFVRRARRQGGSNVITEMALLETAQTLGLRQNIDYSLRTVERIVVANAREMEETDLVSLGGAR